MATCSFPSGFTGDALCRVDFTGPDGVTYTSVSTERGSAGESVTVELTLNGAALLQNTTYYYQATLEISTDASQCVKGINATGNFTTGDYGSSTGTHTSELELTRMFKSFIIDTCLVFITECTLDSIGANVSNSSECAEGEMAGDIPNGMLCYTGLTPGSTATYSCDKGYELNGSSTVLECIPSGVWNGTENSCLDSTTS